MVDDGRAADAGAIGDLGDAGLAEAPLADDVRRGLQDLSAPALRRDGLVSASP